MDNKPKSIGFRDGSLVDAIYESLRQKKVILSFPKDIKGSRGKQIAWIVEQYAKNIDRQNNEVKSINNLQKENTKLKTTIQHLNSKIKELEKSKTKKPSNKTTPKQKPQASKRYKNDDQINSMIQRFIEEDKLIME